MKLEEEIQSLIKNDSGGYNHLEREADPELLNPDYPDASHYSIVGPEVDENGARLHYLVEDTRLLDAAVKALKRIHKIEDPWDNNPDYFQAVAKESAWEPAPGSRESGLPRYFLWKDRIGRLSSDAKGGIDFQIYEEESDTFSSHPDIAKRVLDFDNFSDEVEKSIFENYIKASKAKRGFG